MIRRRSAPGPAAPGGVPGSCPTSRGAAGLEAEVVVARSPVCRPRRCRAGSRAGRWQSTRRRGRRVRVARGRTTRAQRASFAKPHRHRDSGTPPAPRATSLIELADPSPVLAQRVAALDQRAAGARPSGRSSGSRRALAPRPRRERLDVAGGAEPAGLAVVDQLRQPEDVGGEDRQLPGHRLEHGSRQRLDVGGADEQVGHPVPGLDVGGDRDQLASGRRSGESSMYSPSSIASPRPCAADERQMGLRVAPRRSARRPGPARPAPCGARPSRRRRRARHRRGSLPPPRRGAVELRPDGVDRLEVEAVGNRQQRSPARRTARTAAASPRPRRSATAASPSARLGADAHLGVEVAPRAAPARSSRGSPRSPGSRACFATSTPGKAVTVAVLTNTASNPRSVGPGGAAPRPGRVGAAALDRDAMLVTCDGIPSSSSSSRSGPSRVLTTVASTRRPRSARAGGRAGRAGRRRGSAGG